MSSDEEPKKAKLAKIAKIRTWHLIYVFVSLTLLPNLTKGTSAHEVVATLATGTAASGLLWHFFWWWFSSSKLAKWAYETIANSRNSIIRRLKTEAWRIAGILVGAVYYLILFKMFTHDGNWESTLALSHGAAIYTLLLTSYLFWLNGSSLRAVYPWASENYKLAIMLTLVTYYFKKPESFK